MNTVCQNHAPSTLYPKKANFIREQVGPPMANATMATSVRVPVATQLPHGGRAVLLHKRKVQSSDLCPETDVLNALNPELNPICYLLALLGAHHFLHINRIRVKSLTIRLLMSYIYIYIYIYGAPILDVSRSHTTTQHSR